MCARRFLTIIFVLTLFVVAGAFAIYQWGDRILIRESTPKGHFDAAKAGGGPDYARPLAWISRPGAAGPADWTPAREPSAPGPGNAQRAAVFYIHPTTYLETDRWNAPLDDGAATAFRTRIFVQSQASAFNGIGDIWAPRYRQAAYGAFLLKSGDAQKALDLAYRDVAAAFDEFLRQNPTGPIILAGHSQGGLHLERLLKEKIAGTPVAKRIVAAYVAGWPISTTVDLPALGLPACRTADEAGCILSWMTFGDPPNPDFILSGWEQTPGINGGARRQEDMLCVNPISGIQNGVAQPEENPGTLIPSVDMRSATLQAGVVGAHCAKGLLILDGIPPAAGGYVLPGNNYHAYDYALFWGAIRQDASRRFYAWLKLQH